LRRLGQAPGARPAGGTPGGRDAGRAGLAGRGLVRRDGGAGETRHGSTGKPRPGWCVSGRIVLAGTVGPLRRLTARAWLGPGCQMGRLPGPEGDRMRDSGTLSRLLRDT